MIPALSHFLLRTVPVDGLPVNPVAVPSGATRIENKASEAALKQAAEVANQHEKNDSLAHKPNALLPR
jgi:hypothetical protein